jgi:uncharacterized protein
MESSSLPWYEKKKDAVDVFVKVTPFAKKVGVTLNLEDARPHKLKIGVSVAPEGGKANKAVIDLLSDLLHLKKSAFQVHAGALKREKTIRIMGDPDEILALCLKIFLEKTA